MPIELIEQPEPFSDASTVRKPMLIGSSAFRLLQHELRRYCNREVTGRSFLIAGHRGSGKTTIVQAAFEAVRSELEEGQDRQPSAPRIGLRPLFVLLQGPNLLPSNKEKAPTLSTKDSQAGGSANGSTAQDEAGSSGEMENVLIQITLGLYRSLAREFTRAFRARIGEYQSGIMPQRSFRMPAQALELAAQLEVDLDGYPGKTRLREYWRSIGHLHQGVLFPSYVPPMATDQGYRELVALSSACEVYRRICGKISRKEERKTSAESKAEAKFALDSKESPILKPLIALLTGGLAGTGVLAANSSAPLSAAFAGIATALGATIVLKYSASLSRSRSTAEEDLFVPDLSVATLDRILPVVIERIRAAGLAPVFVVDELDKVVGLSERITEMVRRLKKFVAENAFFCFLTDRTYFEELRERMLVSAYPIEYTYFTNNIFVVFAHRELHQYLDRVLEPPHAEVPTDLGATDRELAEYSTDREVLPYILLYSSQMHPFELRRKLAAIRSPRGYVSLDPGSVRSRPRYRLELMVQVAIEMVLEDEAMQAEIDREPEFLRLAIDALYYVPRRWADAPEPLLLDAAGEPAFEDYLRDRMATESFERPAAGESNEAPNPALSGTFRAGSMLICNDDQTLTETGRQGKRPKVSPSSRRFLLERVRQLASLLAHPSELRQRAKAKPLPQVVLDALPDLPLLNAGEGRPNVYYWRCFESARPIEEEGSETTSLTEPIKRERWAHADAVVAQLAKKLSAISNENLDFSSLSSQFGIIGTTPAWTDVKRALARLDMSAHTGLPYPEQEADLAVLNAFEKLIESSRETITLALFCADVIGAWSERQDGTRTLAGLKAISVALSLRDMPVEDVSAALKKLKSQLETLFQIESNLFGAYDLALEGSVSWEWARAILDKTLEPFPLDRFVSGLWEKWGERLRSGKTANFAPEIPDMICSAADVGAARYLKLSLSSMTAGDWSECVYDCLKSEPIPLWIAEEALHRLGFDSRSSSAMLKPRRATEAQTEPPAPDLSSATDRRKRQTMVVTMPDSRAILARSAPPKRGAALVLDLQSALEAVDKWKAVKEELRFDFLVLEGGREIDESLDEVRPLRNFFDTERAEYFGVRPAGVWTGTRLMFCYPLGDPSNRDAALRRIVGVQSLDEFFLEAERLVRDRDSSSQPRSWWEKSSRG